MGIAIAPIESADDHAVELAYQIAAAALAVDVPDLPPVCRESFRGRLAYPWPDLPARHFLASLDGEPAGYLNLLLPDLDNTENAHIDLAVHPAYRRRGVGRRLVEQAAAIAQQDGRKRLVGDSVAALPGGVDRTDTGAQFADSLGAKPALADVRLRLDLARVDDDVRTELLAEAWLHADGYSLVWFRDVVPGDLLPDMAYLDGRLNKDAPLGDLSVEPELMDARRIRAAEAASRGRKRRRYSTGVRHNASGRLVAVTTLDLEHCPADHAWQQVTVVDPRHRGHRLGLIAKIENLRYARVYERELRLIDTWNAAANVHMIAINEQIGFRPVDSWSNWQLDL